MIGKKYSFWASQAKMATYLRRSVYPCPCALSGFLIHFFRARKHLSFYAWVFIVTLCVIRQPCIFLTSTTYPGHFPVLERYSGAPLPYSLEVICFPLLFSAIRSWYGRGVYGYHMILSCVLLSAWRWAYAAFFQPSMARIPVLILGGGTIGRAVYELLKS